MTSSTGVPILRTYSEPCKAYYRRGCGRVAVTMTRHRRHSLIVLGRMPGRREDGCSPDAQGTLKETQGLRFWLFKGGFKVSSGTA